MSSAITKQRTVRLRFIIFPPPPPPMCSDEKPMYSVYPSLQVLKNVADNRVLCGEGATYVNTRSSKMLLCENPFGFCDFPIG